MNRSALVLGIGGQTGSYMADVLLERGYTVYGMMRRSSNLNLWRIAHLMDRLKILEGDLLDEPSLRRVLMVSRPHEVYNFAAQSQVGVSFLEPIHTSEVTGLGALRLFEAVRLYTNLSDHTRVYQASCYDIKTKVLTTSGLKNYHEVKVGDVVFTVNVATNSLELKSVKRVITTNYTGEMIRFSGRRINLLVTPNHQMLFTGNQGNFYTTAGGLTFSEEAFFHRQSSVKLSNPVWAGKSVSEMKLSEISPCDIPCNAKKNLLDIIDTNDLFWLTGLYIGDGYCSPTKYSFRSGSKTEFMSRRKSNGQFISQQTTTQVTYPSHNIYFAIPVTDKSRKQLIDWLNKYRVEYHVSNNWIRFSSYTLATFLQTCGKSVKEKHIPSWMLEFSREHLKALFDGLIGSDGYVKSNTISYSYTSVSNILIEQIAELCIKLGFRCKVSKKIGKDILFIKERRIIHSSDAYVAYISDNHIHRPISLYPHHVSRVPYNGIVWCLEVEDNHNFMVERDGHYAFSGNSSEMFGEVAMSPQTELTPFHPVSPYGVCKLYAHSMAQVYRKAYGMFIACGIAFNHESPRRSEEFVTRKITRTLALIVAGQADMLRLGNTSARRDWSHARDIAEGAWKLLQHPTPEDVIFASGTSHSVQEFYEYAFNYVGLDPQQYVKVEPSLFRPTDIQDLVGHAEKARLLLGWQPRYTFPDLVKEMVDADLSTVGARRPSPSEGPPAPDEVPPELASADVPEVTA